MKKVLSLLVCLLLFALHTNAQTGGSNDCANAEVVCSNESFGFNPMGPGLDDFADPDNHPGCMTALEQNSVWYYFEIDPAAPPNLVLGFTILPLGGLGEDYDWALFGPNVTCNTLGFPIRCSSSSAQCGFCPETGMGMGTTDLTEGPGTGDGFVMTLVVQPGQGFFLLIDNWQGTNNGFTLTWTGTAADYLDCDATPPCALGAIAGTDVQVCENDDSFQLYGSSIGNHGSEVYSWTGTNGGTSFLNDPSLQNPTVTLPPGFSGTIIYTLVVSEDTCVGEDAVNVVVNPLPAVTINPIGPFCESAGPQTLSGTPGGGQWGGEAVGNMFHPALAGPGTHLITYTFTDFKGCRNTAELEIEVFEAPVVEISPDPASFCDSDGSVLLTASGSEGTPDYMYTWSSPAGPGSGPTFDAPLSGNYIVTVTDENGCTNTSNVQVESFVNPEINILNPQPICQSTLVHTILATPSGGEFDGAQIDPSGEIYPSLLTPGTYSYSYSYTDNNNCSSTLFSNFTIIPAPSATATNNEPSCSSQPIFLFGSTNATGSNITYQWTGPNGYSSTDQNPTDATEAGVYELIVTVDGCPSLPVTTTVNFGQSIAVSITGDDTICIGSTTILDAGPGFLSYQWSNGDMNQTTSVSTSGIYEVTVTDPGGCTGFASITVTVLDALIPVIIGDPEFCEGGSTVLDAGSGYSSYQWSSGETSQTINVSIAGTYNVLVTNSDGCSGSANVNVIIHQNPNVVIGGSTSFCIGGFSTLDAGNGYSSYTWSTGSPDQTIIVNMPGVYSVDVVDMFGCPGSATVTVTESTSLSPVITGTPAYCEDGSTTLSAGSGFATYLWSDGSLTEQLTVSTAGIYSVTVSDGQGCSGSSSVMVTEVSPPSAQVQNAVSLCNTSAGGSTIDLYSLVIGGDSNGTWTDVDNSGAFGPFTNLDFNGIATGNYLFVYTTNSAIAPCDEVSYNVTVTVSDCDCEDVFFIPTPSICNFSSTFDITSLQSTSIIGTWTLDQTPAGSSPAVLSGTIFQTNQSDPGLYTFIFTPADTPPPGCPLNYSASIQVDETVSAGEALPTLQFCENSTGTVQLDQQLSNADPGGTWIETSSTPSQNGAFNASSATFTIDQQTASIYTFSYQINSSGACPDNEETVTIQIQPVPVALIETPDILDCAISTIELNATGSIISSDDNITWSGPGIVQDGNESTLTPTVNQSGTYTLQIETSAGCLDSASVVVIAQTDPPTGAEIQTSDPGCFGESNGNISVQNVEGGSPPYMYSINNSAFTNTPVFNGLSSGSFTISIIDAFNCLWDTTLVLTDPMPFDIDLGDNIELGLGETGFIQVQTSLTPAAIDSVIWTPQNQITCLDPKCLEVSVLPIGVTLVTATLVDTDGCKMSDAIQVFLNVVRRFYVPNVFSPNGDGVNDFFYASADLSQVEKINAFEVFDRWGNKVYAATDIQPNNASAGWDGNNNGKLLNPGVFSYRIEVLFIDKVTIQYTGDVTLVR